MEINCDAFSLLAFALPHRHMRLGEQVTPSLSIQLLMAQSLQGDSLLYQVQGQLTSSLSHLKSKTNQIHR